MAYLGAFVSPRSRYYFVTSRQVHSPFVDDHNTWEAAPPRCGFTLSGPSQAAIESIRPDANRPSSSSGEGLVSLVLSVSIGVPGADARSSSASVAAAAGRNPSHS